MVCVPFKLLCQMFIDSDCHRTYHNHGHVIFLKENVIRCNYLETLEELMKKDKIFIGFVVVAVIVTVVYMVVKKKKDSKEV